MGDIFTHAMPGGPCLRLSRRMRTRFERKKTSPIKVTQNTVTVTGFCPPSFRCKGNRAQWQTAFFKIKCLFSEAGALLWLAEFLQEQVKDQILPFSVTSSSKPTSILVETLQKKPAWGTAKICTAKQQELDKDYSNCAEELHHREHQHHLRLHYVKMYLAGTSCN